MLAMEKAVASLKKKPDYVVIDGNRVPAGLDQGSAEAVVKGDLKVMSVAAASVLAKVHR